MTSGTTIGGRSDLHHDEIKDLEAIVQHSDYSRDRVAFSYLRQANLASTPIHFTLNLLMAAEAFTGGKTISRKCRNRNCSEVYKYQSFNKEGLKKIYGLTFFEELYKKKKIRHKLIHGGKVNESEVVEAGKKAYEKIVLIYVKEKYGLLTLREIMNAPRSGCFRYKRTFVKNKKIPKLEELEKHHDQLVFVRSPEEY